MDMARLKYSIITGFCYIFRKKICILLICHLLISGLLKGAVDINPIIPLALRIFCSADSVKKDKFKVFLMFHRSVFWQAFIG